MEPTKFTKISEIAAVLFFGILTAWLILAGPSPTSAQAPYASTILSYNKAESGQPVLTILRTTNFKAGQRIVIHLSLQSFERKTIASVDSGTQLTLTTNLENTVPAGSRVDNLVLNPLLVGLGKINGEPMSIHVSGNRAYVVTRTGSQGKLEILDVSELSTPSLVGAIFIDKDPRDVYISGNYAYVVNQGSNTLQIFDVSDPGISINPYSSPVAVGSVKTDSAPYSIHVSGIYAYVVNINSNTLQVFNVADPSRPRLVKSVDTEENPRSVYVSGQYAYVVNELSNTLQVFNIANPSSPRLEGSVKTGKNPYSVYVSGNFAYVASYVYGLQIFDVSDHTNPVERGSAAIRTPYPSFRAPAIPIFPRGLGNIYVSGKFAYVAYESGLTAFSVYDISNPDSPIKVGFSHNGAPTFHVSGNLIYTISYHNGKGSLLVLDISGNKTASAAEIKVGAAAVVTIWNEPEPGTLCPVIPRTTPIDVPDPNPALVGSTVTDISLRSVFVSGQYAYTVGNIVGLSVVPNFQIFDVSTANPTLVGSASGAGSFDVQVSGQYAYVNGGVLKIFNISDPTNPKLEGSISVLRGITKFRVFGNYVYVLTGDLDARFKIFDVSNPANPTLVGSASGAGAFDVQVSDNYAYLLTTSRPGLQLEVFNISDPTNPIPEGSVNTHIDTDLKVQSYLLSPYGHSLSVSGNYAYVVQQIRQVSGTTSNVIQIIDISNPANPELKGSVNTDSTVQSVPTDIYVSGKYVYLTALNPNILQIFYVADPLNPVRVCSVYTGIFPSSVHVSGQYAYVANRDHGLQKFDVSGCLNKTSPLPVRLTPDPVAINLEAIGFGPAGNEFQISGQYAYGVRGSSLQITDISDPIWGRRAGSVVTSGAGTDVYLSGRYAYVTTARPAYSYSSVNSLRIFDVFNPASPVEIGSVDIDRSPFGVHVSGNYAYVISMRGGSRGIVPGSGRLQIFDISDPSSPKLISSIGIADTAPSTRLGSLYVSGPYVYVTGLAENTLQIFDVSNPTKPKLVSSIRTDPNPNSIYVSGQYAYVSSFSNSLQIFKVSDPTNPKLIGAALTRPVPLDVYVLNQYAYMAAGNGVQVFDVSDPSNPIEVDFTEQLITDTRRIARVYASDNFVYANRPGSMLVFDACATEAIPVTPPPTPTEVVVPPPPPVAPPVYVGTLKSKTISGLQPGTTYYCAIKTKDEVGNQSQLSNVASFTTLPSVAAACPLIVDSQPVKGSVKTLLGPWAVSVSGDYAYVVNFNSNTLQIFDVSDPLNLTGAGSASTGVGPLAVAVKGNFAYVTIHGSDDPENPVPSSFLIFDISDPSSPVSTGSAEADGSPRSIQISGDYAYVVNWNANTLQVFNISDPSSPVSVKSVGTDVKPRSISISGNYAYVVHTGSNTLRVFDISNPENPKLVGLPVNTGTDPRSVYVSGNYAYVANTGSDTLQIFNISTPSAPKSVATVSTDVIPQEVYVSGNYAYLVNVGSHTLQVFDVSNPLKPVDLGSVETDSDARSVYVSNKYAYVVNWESNTLEVFDVSGTCPIPVPVAVPPVAPPPVAPPVLPPSIYSLTVSKTGTGSGTVTGPGVSCGPDCSEDYPLNTGVTLTAAADDGSEFVGWGGACAGTVGNVCTVTIDAVKSVTVIFALVVEVDTIPPADVINLDAFNPTTTTIDLSWTASGDDGDNGTATIYDVRYSAKKITEKKWDSATPVTGEPIPSPAGTKELMTVSGLDPDTKYYFAIKTSDEVDNESGISNSPKETTLPITKVTVTEQPDGTKITVTEEPDGTKVTVTEKPDGTKVTVTEKPDGTVITENPDGITVTEKPDGITVTVDPDGTTIITEPDGTTVTVYPDGTTVITNPDGTTVTTDPEGVTVTKKPDGTTVTTTPDGTSVTTKPDGTVIIENPDGTIVITESDGTVVTTKPDGTTITEKPDGTAVVTDPDGTTVTTEPDGTTVTEKPDGITITKKPDGIIITTEPDGTTVTEKPDGTTITEKPDGIIVIEKPDGTTVTTTPDGININTEPDGSVEINTPTGTTITTDPGEATVIEKPDGTTINTEPDGTVEVNLPDGTIIDTDPDGTVALTDPDGTSVVTESDGTIIVTDPDDSEETTVPGLDRIAEITTSIGTVVVTDPNKTTIEKPDGTIVTVDPDDGTIIIITPDETIISTDSDGSTKTTDADGTSVVTEPDGTTVTEQSDGTTITTGADGAVEVEPAGIIETIVKGIGKGFKKAVDFIFGVEGPRMTGGGSIGNTDTTHGFTLHCDASEEPNNLEINWGKKGKKLSDKFHLENLTSVTCLDDPNINPLPRPADFDTYIGAGVGRYNGVSGATIEFTFTDAGEPGKNDFAKVFIKDANGKVVLDVSDNLKFGNHQAHQ